MRTERSSRVSNKGHVRQTHSRTFYSQELQKMQMKETYIIENVLKKRSRKGRMKYFVKLKGYPYKFHQWIYLPCK